MWSVSARFLAAIPSPHQLGTTVTVTPPGGTAIPLTVSAGSLQVQGGQLARRTADLYLNGGSAVYDLVSIPGCRFQVQHGIVWSAHDQELVPVITGELSDAAQTLGDGLIEVHVTDLWQRLAACQYLTAYTPSTSATRVSEMSAAVTGAIAGVTVTNGSSDTGTVGTVQTWQSRADLVAAFATDGATEAFFLPDGNFRIRDEPLITGTPVWTISPDSGGTLTSVQRTRPMDQLYNTVIVTPSSLAGTQTWTQVVAQITDTANPRHPSKIGVRPYTWQSPSIMSTGQATTAAATLLGRASGSTETLTLGAISNPALEAGDPVTVKNITDTGDVTSTYLVSNFQLDLISGAMTVGVKGSDPLS